MIFSFSRRVFLVLFFIVGVFFLYDTFALSSTKEATYYADAFDGGRTANGDRFDQKGFSAALCDLPLGQYIHVQKGNTGVVLDANDRPNCTRHPEIVDMSQAAFRLFAPLSVGRIALVQMTPLGPASTKQIKTFLPRDTFSHLGIILTTDIPTVLFVGEGIEVKGKTTLNSPYVLIYAVQGDAPPVNILVKVAPDKTFRGFLPLADTPAETVFIVASGNSFDTDKYAILSLIPRESLTYPDIPTNDRMKILPKITTLYGSDPTIRLPDGITGEIEITQGKNSFRTAGTSLILRDLPFSPGNAYVKIRGYSISTPSSLDRGVYHPSLFSGTILFDRTHDTIGTESIVIQSRLSHAKFRFKTPMDVRIRDKYYLTAPNGDVKEYHFPKSSTTNDGYLKKGITLTGSVLLQSKGTYLLEVVKEDGVAFINVPITRGIVWSILPPLSEKEISTLRKDTKLVISATLDRINTLRKNLKKNPLVLDQSLTLLAQAKVEDMIGRSYQGHADPDGNYIDFLAQKLGIETGGSIGENIGYGTISDMALQDGLEESGVHRMNMLDADWNRVGIGYANDNGKVYLVHVFGE